MSALVSNEALNIFNVVVYYGVRPVILVAGSVTCTFSAYVFFRMGLTDSVRVSFFVLCIFDLGFVLTSSVGAVCIILNNGFIELSGQMVLSPIYVNSFSYWCANIFYHSSLITTGYISGVRCCCVAIPFKFRKIFSTERTAVALLVIFIVSCSFQLPVMATQYVGYFRDKRNATKAIILPTGEHDAAVLSNDIFNRNILSWLTMAVMAVSLAIMAVKLRSAAKFRKLATSGQQIETENVPNDRNYSLKNGGSTQSTTFCHCSKSRSEQRLENSDCNNSQIRTNDSENKTINGFKDLTATHKTRSQWKKTQISQENLKELQIIRSVALITALVLVLALPFMVYSLVRRLMPQFNRGELYGNLFQVVTSLSAVCAYLNSSLNVLVFYCFNTKFRITANESLLCSRTGGKI